VTRPEDTLTLQAAPPPEPAYPTRTQRPSRVASSLRIAAGTAGASTLLGGCALLWPLLAPIFEHGRGNVAFGCVAVSPPVFLSEEDAAEIVRQELVAAGYDAVETGSSCTTFSVNRLKHKETISGEDWEVLEGAVVTDRFDLCDRDASFTLEVVTNNDYERLVTEPGFSGFSGWSYDIRDLADHVALAALAGTRSRYVGVFYAPTGPDDWDWDTGEAAVAEVEELLRTQVRDFVVWLHDNGG